MDEFIEHDDGIDVATAKLLSELSVDTGDDHALQAFLNKATGLGISRKTLIRLLTSNEGKRFTKKFVEQQNRFERDMAVATGSHLRPVI
jgi:hypothetical protein